MSAVFSSFEKFKEAFSDFVQRNPEKAEAIRLYMLSGGIISVSNNNGFPLINYPSKNRIKTQINSIELELSSLLKDKAKWQKKFFKAKFSNAFNSVKKLTSKDYWKHNLKYFFDKDYKNDFDSVNLPINLIAEKKYAPMISMFVNNESYRKQLVETVKTSIIYENTKVAKHSNEIKELRMSVSSKKIDGFNEKIRILRQSLKILKSLESLLKK